MRAIVGVTVSAVIVLAACNDTDSPKKQATAPPSTSSPTPTTAQTVVAPAPATSAPPAPTGSGAPNPSATSGTPPARQAASTEAAIQRYEQFLHAVGREDLATVCDIAGPAAKKAQDDGFGPCTSTMPITFGMFSAAQKKAMQTATVDPSRVSARRPDRVEVPAKAVRASVPFSESDLGNQTLQYIDNAWYIVDQG
ncbi:hypothetical protein B4N89_36575 [Embleya scabrispora]|uniref:Uncharacterized protein n=1 Tax=Embleya scabrispora TaxID=159449 RepID=A0A1T3NM66_9ACTN|nr:hypothetical protein [Embleya scabrispora]OPC77798.1 hypothetical protein B4N89_36575 [Embleya scabrispora]